MRKILFASILTISMFIDNASYAKTNIWQPLAGKYAPSKMEMIQQPSSYKIFQLDNAAMQSFLKGVSYEYEQASIIELPTPEGTFRKFRVWKNTTMHPELAAKFPEIMTFTIEQVGNNLVTGKLGFNLFGFNAFVMDGQNSYFIDPYSNANDGYYMAFYKKDLKEESFTCGTKDQLKQVGISDLDNTESAVQINNETPVPPPYSHGAQQKVFRTAITCTGEFAILITGTRTPTIAQTLSKIVDIVNRINSYYEREIAVSLELIPNNDQIVFTNPNTDPFNYNAILERLLDESHNTIVSRVGTNSFDLGHIFCTASGGLATTPSVCNNNTKGRAGSGMGSTTNVHVAMHEMGHQMNASHTFSANTGTCQGNGMPEGAYESGSGVTIMSYSGCTGSDVPKNKDEYFHVNTLLEISKHLSTVTCGTYQTNIPVLSIPNLNDVYNIPLNTPFELTGKAATVQGTQIPQTFLYNWEQYDKEFDLVEPDMSDKTSGPSLKSHYPNPSLSQAYPPTTEIIEGNYSLPGYRLPKVGRELSFKFTARGILNGKGAFNTIDDVVKLNAVSGTGPFRVTSQSSSATWNPGDAVTITWDVANTNQNPINCNGVSIYLHFPDGSQPDYLLVSYAPNTGSATYTVQNFYAEGGYIKIKAAGNVFFDVGKGKINVNGTKIDENTLSNSVDVYPNPASDKITIKNNINHKDLSVKIIGINGQLVWTGAMTNTLEINTSNFAKGNYVIQIIDDVTGTITNKQVVIK